MEDSRRRRRGARRNERRYDHANVEPRAGSEGADEATATPITHVVVIFDENNSFDHYFGTYPTALNPAGEPAFNAAPGTPTVNGLTPALLNNNPNSVQPFRLDPSMALTCDNDNHYADEQKAYDSGLVDKFPESTLGTGCPTGLNMAITTATQ